MLHVWVLKNPNGDRAFRKKESAVDERHRLSLEEVDGIPISSLLLQSNLADDATVVYAVWCKDLEYENRIYIQGFVSQEDAARAAKFWRVGTMDSGYVEIPVT